MRSAPSIAAVIVALLPLAAAAHEWQVIHDESVLGFTTTQQGRPFDGSFDFEAEMRFNADDLDNAAFDVTIDVTSVETGVRDRDRALAEPEFFHFDEFPRAYFRTTSIEAGDSDTYKAHGELTIRDITHEVTLPFTWEEDGNTAQVNGAVTAVMEGGLTMEPLDWDVGEEEWVKDGDIGRETEVYVDLLLERDED